MMTQVSSGSTVKQLSQVTFDISALTHSRSGTSKQKYQVPEMQSLIEKGHSVLKQCIVFQPSR